MLEIRIVFVDFFLLCQFILGFQLLFKDCFSPDTFVGFGTLWEVLGRENSWTCVVNLLWGRASLSICVFFEMLGELSGFGTV